MDKIECESDDSDGFAIEDDDDDFEIIDIEESNEDSSNKQPRIKESYYFDVTEDTIYPTMVEGSKGAQAKIHIRNRKGIATDNILKSLKIDEDYMSQVNKLESK